MTRQMGSQRPLSLAISSFSARLSRRAGVDIPACLLASTVFVTSCEQEPADLETRLDPVELEILGAQNTSGKRFDRDDEKIRVNCDPRLTILLGPNKTSPSLLDNWNLFPRGVCEEAPQCGYLRVQFLDKNDKVLLQRDQSSISPVFDLSELELDRVKSVHALLIDGRDDKGFKQEGERVFDTWKVSIEAADSECPADGSEGMGGYGGMGGFSGE